MSSNEPDEITKDSTVDSTQLTDSPVYQTEDAEKPSLSAPSGEDKNESAGSQVIAAQTLETPAREPAPVESIADGVKSPLPGEVKANDVSFKPGIMMAVLFTFVSAAVSGTFVGAICGVSLSLLLTAYWAYANYRLCKLSRVSSPTPLRCVAMSFLCNQFSVVYAAIFSNALLELVYPVLHMIRPPDAVMSFASLAGNILSLALVAGVLTLSFQWHRTLGKKVYSARSESDVTAAIGIALTFSCLSIALVLLTGVAEYYVLAPIAINACWVPVFVMASFLQRSGSKRDEVLTTHVITPPEEGASLTAEWLVLCVYAVSVGLSNPFANSYGNFAAIFYGLPAFIWFVYLVCESKARARKLRSLSTESLIGPAQ